MPQLWKSAKQSVAFGSLFLMRIPTAAWKSLDKALGFSTFTTGPATIHQYGITFHLKNYKGWMRNQKFRVATEMDAAGVVFLLFHRKTTPASHSRMLRNIFLVAQPP